MALGIDYIGKKVRFVFGKNGYLMIAKDFDKGPFGQTRHLCRLAP
jgi:hypothetical protein